MANSPQIEFLPEPGMDVRQLFILLHRVGGTPDSLLPLAEAVRAAFPAAVLIPEGFEPFDGGGAGRQWFSVRGVTEKTARAGGGGAAGAGRLCAAGAATLRPAAIGHPGRLLAGAPSWRWSWCRRMTAWPAA